MEAKDIEDLEKVAQTAALLVSDLQALHGTSNPLLSELAYGLLESAVATKSKVDRLIVATSQVAT